MKKHVLILSVCALVTGIVIAQSVDVPLVNAGFETPDDSSKIKCNDTAFTAVEGFGWRIDECNDVGREEPIKFGGLSAGENKQAYEGWHVAFSHNLPVGRTGHVYQIVEDVSAIPIKYTLTSQAIWSWTDVWTCYPTNYISLFSGTDTTNRVIVAGDSVLVDSLTLIDYESDYTLVQWQELNVTYTTKPEDEGKHLCIEFGNWAAAGSSWTYFYHDDFKLTKSSGNAINNINIAQLKVFPNPSNGTFYIKLQEKANYKVFNMLGKEIASGQLNQNINKIDLSSVGSGLYMLQVETLNQTTINKLVVK